MNKTEHHLFLELIEDVASLRKEVAELKTHKKFHYRLFYNNKWYDKYLDFMLRVDDEFVWIGRDGVFGRITRVTYDSDKDYYQIYVDRFYTTLGMNAKVVVKF